MMKGTDRTGCTRQDASVRILWIHQNFVAGEQPGSERPTHTIAAFLERGWDVDLVTGTSSYQGAHMGEPGTRREGTLAWHRVSSGTGEYFLHRRTASYLRFIAGSAQRSRRLPSPDLVFASTPPLPQIALAMGLAARHRVPMLLEVRDLWPGFLVDMGLIRSRTVRRGLEALESAAYRCATRIVSASPAFRPYLEGFGVPPSRIVDIPHGARRRDLCALRERGEEMRRALGLADCTVLLYAGSLNESHGLRAVVDAARRTAACDGIRWLVAGNGRGRPMLEQASRALPNLLDLGAVPRRDLDPVLGAADAGIVALAPHRSFETVLPGKLVDYLSAGLPVICAVPGQARRVVEASNAGWLCEPDGGALAEAALRVHATTGAERHERGDAGAAWIARHMSAERQGRMVADVCAEALRNPSPRPRALTVIRALGRGLFTSDVSHMDATYRAADNARRSFDAWLGSIAPDDAPPMPLTIPALLR
jgi:hypothetical protein